MRRPLFLALSLAFLAGAAPATAPAYIDDATPFIAFADATAGQPDPVRIAAFHAIFDKRLPDFYQRSTLEKQARIDAAIAVALKNFPEKRAAFSRAIAQFAPAFAAAQVHFRDAFPDYALSVPVHLVQSFGQMDGGTRMIGGRTAMLFGADVIGAIHDETTIGPFLDHELFHIYHQRHFPECDRIWCALWIEGLAVYVAGRLNPGASDRQLLLSQPQPLRPAVEPRLAEAMCFLKTRFDSKRAEDYAPLFEGSPSKVPFPPRFGYLLGEKLAARIGAQMSLGQLAALPPATVRPMLLKVIASYGACPPRP